jgi:dipeptidyl aminopeptidase/acylaminoacyl peptidase
MLGGDSVRRSGMGRAVRGLLGDGGVGVWKLRFSALIGWSAVFANPADAGQRPWLPQDSVSIRYVSPNPAFPEAWWLYDPDEKRAIFRSPDGAYVSFMTHHGEIESDARVVELHVYAVQELADHLTVPSAERGRMPAGHHLTFRSYSAEPAQFPMGGTFWRADKPEIVFTGMSSDRTKQIYRLDVRTGTLKQVTRHAAGVSEFYARGEGVVFQSRESIPFVPGYPEASFPWRQSRIESLPAVQRTKDLSVFADGDAREVKGATRATWDREWISPNGRFAFTVVNRRSMLGMGERNPGWRRHFLLIDLQSGNMRAELPLEQSDVTSLVPNASRDPWVFWAQDSSRVILTRVAERSGAGSFLAEYELAAGRLSILEPTSGITGAGWLKEGQELLVTHGANGEPGPGKVYIFESARVVSREVDAALAVPTSDTRQAGFAIQLPQGITIELQQGPNQPPQVVASDGKREATLTGPDSVVSDVWLAQSQPFQWQEGGGVAMTGGLMLPRNFTKGSPVPLVIHAYDYKPEWFLPDGQSRTPSEAKQALAARGFAVLEIDTLDAPEAPEKIVARVDAAVDALVQAGIADPDRIGMTGFSRGGYHTYFAITHPGRTRIAAAICADSFKGDYASYLGYAPFGDAYNVDIVAGGGKSFWADKETWLERETSFNVDRVKGATMFTLHSYPGQNYMGEMRTIGAFLINKKPVDYRYFPTGSHSLQRPRERLAMMEATLDWMAFWLQGYEDPSPEKAEQNARWRRMRQEMPRVSRSN